MKLVSKCGEMFIDMPDDIDYNSEDVKRMVKDLQEALDNIGDKEYFLHPSDWEGGLLLIRKQKNYLSCQHEIEERLMWQNG